jgi:hypothetical protein
VESNGVTKPVRKQRGPRSRANWLVGHEIGDLKVLMWHSKKRTNKRKYRYQNVWMCLCRCGAMCFYTTDHLTRKTRPVVSCGCRRRACGSAHKDWKGVEDISGAWFSTHITHHFGRRDSRKVLDVSVTIEYLWELFVAQDRKCALTRLPLIFAANRKKTDTTASLDRIDSNLGYVPGNVQWVHKHVNIMKNAFNQDYFIHICTLVAEKNGVCGI